MKSLVVISCPIDTHSGYGARSRDIAKALIKTNKYDVKIIPQRWGNTPFGFLQANNPEHKLIIDCIWAQPQLPKQPDCWIQITVPNEFQSIGKFNIGITAGIETTICDPSWIDGCNRMNLILTSSEHAKKIFESSIFEEKDQQTQQVKRKIELTVPIKVLFEGIDIDLYKKLDNIPEGDIKDTLDSIEEEFCFLFVGHWLQGDLGQDRKDVGMMIKTFLETFKDKKIQPALILKTSGGTYSILDRDDVLEKINSIRQSVKGNLPNIYLLHGELSDEEMNELYNHPKVKTLTSFTKGEGYGRPLAEFAMSQKPVIVSNWSGHLDFLKYSILLGGQLTQLHPSSVVQNMLLAESSWFTVDYKEASKILEDIYKNYSKKLDLAKKQSYLLKTEFSLEKMQELLDQIFEEKVPKPIQLKLPQLKKIELPKLKKVE